MTGKEICQKGLCDHKSLSIADSKMPAVCLFVFFFIQHNVRKNTNKRKL